MRYAGWVIASILVVGLAGAVVALRSREDNAQFVSRQRALAPVTAVQVERLILTTSDPRPMHAGRARRVRCVSGAHDALGNPWSCVVRYPRPPRVRYRVTVHADRSIYGYSPPEGPQPRGSLTVRGCCVS
jgi:hypothetical protein